MPGAGFQHIFMPAAAQVISGVVQFQPEPHCIAFFLAYGSLDEKCLVFLHLAFDTSHLGRWDVMSAASAGNLVWATLSMIDGADNRPCLFSSSKVISSLRPLLQTNLCANLLFAPRRPIRLNNFKETARDGGETRRRCNFCRQATTVQF
jgi:hypothetical protein